MRHLWGTAVGQGLVVRVGVRFFLEPCEKRGTEDDTLKTAKTT